MLAPVPNIHAFNGEVTPPCTRQVIAGINADAQMLDVNGMEASEGMKPSGSHDAMGEADMLADLGF